MKDDNRKKFNTWLGITVALGIFFLFLQAEEYIEAYQHMGLTLESGIYGTTFFMLTGFHGMHVTLGTVMLLIQWIRGLKGHFTHDDQFGFEAASWYWHFVDVVWVGLVPLCIRTRVNSTRGTKAARHSLAVFICGLKLLLWWSV